MIYIMTEITIMLYLIISNSHCEFMMVYISLWQYYNTYHKYINGKNHMNSVIVNCVNWTSILNAYIILVLIYINDKPLI